VFVSSLALSSRLDNDLEKLVEEHIENILHENKSTKQHNKKNLKRKYVSSPPTSSSSSSDTNSTTTTLDPSLHQMKFIIEDFTDRKSQLSINSYDIIDQHIRVVDEEIKLLETAIRLSGSDIPPAPSISDMEEMYTSSSNKKKKKKSSENEEDESSSFEPVYCLCQKANYGDMIRCDSDDCAIEWFHYPCVGLTKEPVKRWLCPECLANDNK
jgi:hypothetical protein